MVIAECLMEHQTSEDDKVERARIYSNQSSNLDMLATSVRDHPKNLVRTMVQKFSIPKLPLAACIRLKSTDIELMFAAVEAWVIVVKAIRQMVSKFV